MRRGILIIIMALLCALCIVGIACGESESTGYGFINRDGEVVIEPQFVYAYNFSGDRAMIFDGSLSTWGSPDEGHYGYIDKTGKIIIPTIYTKAESFSENGRAAVCKNGKYGVIDLDGSTVIDFNYDHVTHITNGFKAFNGTLSSYGSPEKGTYHIFDEEGKELFSIECETLYANEDCFEAEKNDKYALVSLTGDMITDFSYASFGTSSESIISFKKTSSGKYGFISVEDGKEIIEAKYDKTGSFHNGQAIVQLDGKYCLIDKTGQIITQYKADYVDVYCDGDYTDAFEGTLTDYGYGDVGNYYLMRIQDGSYVSRAFKKGDCYSPNSGRPWRVEENGLWHLIDNEGNDVVSPIECDSILECGDDRYIIEKNDICALADSTGNLLTDYIYDSMSSTENDLIAIEVAAKNPDFRSVRWGMTKAEVKEQEGSSPDYEGKVNGANTTYIGYNTQLMGNDVIVAFYFGPEGLYAARYIWAETHSNDSLYISDYESVRTQLTKKYGSPLIDNENWDTTNHKKYYADDKGNALSFGYLTYYTWYYTQRSSITMHMSADNYQISFAIDYESNSIKAPEEDYSDQF